MAQSFLDRENAAKSAGGQLNLGRDASVITDAMVSANSASLSAIRAAVVSVAAICRPDAYPVAIKTIQALDVYKDLSIVAENHGLSSISTLVSASGVDSTSRRQGIW